MNKRRVLYLLIGAIFLIPTISPSFFHFSNERIGAVKNDVVDETSEIYDQNVQKNATGEDLITEENKLKELKSAEEMDQVISEDYESLKQKEVIESEEVVQETSTLEDTENIEDSSFEVKNPLLETESKNIDENEINFLIVEGEYFQKNPTENFSIHVKSNIEIDTFRINIPKGATFSIDNEVNRTLVDTNDDESTLWLIRINQKMNLIPIQLQLSESGQISIEDSESQVHAAFLYVETGNTRNSMPESATRTSVNVSNWAQFRSAWNDRNRTVINFAQGNYTGSSSLNKRTTPVTLAGPRGRVASVHGASLSWDNDVKIEINVNMNMLDTTVNGGNLSIKASSVELTKTSALNNLEFVGYGPESATTSFGLEYYSLFLNGASLFISNDFDLTWGILLSNRFPIQVSGTTKLGASPFLLRSLVSNMEILRSVAIEKRTNNNFATWDVNTSPDLTALPNHYWKNLTFSLRNDTIIESSQSTFNDTVYKPNKSRQISSGSGVGIPTLRDGEVIVSYEDKVGNKLRESIILNGLVGSAYVSEAKEIFGWKLTENPKNATGLFTEKPSTVTYVYEKEVISVPPLDPLDPGIEVNPENRPEIPEEQGLLSIDFVSQFNFGKQAISVQDKTYYAQPQRLLNEDETVILEEERPNYVQISDRRPENERAGWELSVTQNRQFTGPNDQELFGSEIRLANQEVVNSQGNIAPSVQLTDPLELVPGVKNTLVTAKKNEGSGTWIYRFGDKLTAGESVSLDIPKGTYPEATSYSTTFVWELSVVPGNE